MQDIWKLKCLACVFTDCDVTWFGGWYQSLGEKLCLQIHSRFISNISEPLPKYIAWFHRKVVFKGRIYKYTHTQQKEIYQHRVSYRHFGLLNSENEGIKIVRNIGISLSVDKTQHPRGRTSSITQLLETEILQI